MIKRTLTCGIDVGTHTTRIVVAEQEKDKSYPSIIATTYADSNGMRLGYITNPQSVISSIKKAVTDAEKITKSKIKKGYISIGGIGMEAIIATGQAITSKADKEVTTLDVNKALAESEEHIPLSNKKILHIIPIAYKLDGKEIHGRPEGMYGVKLEVKSIFITITKQHLEDLINAVTEAGVEVIDVSAGILSEASILLTEKQKTAGCAIVNIGTEVTTIAVFENNVLISMQTFHIGGMDITKDIALGFKISLEEAEGIKTGTLMTELPKKKIDEIIEARLSDVFELVENHLKKIKRNGLLPAGIILTGGSANIQNIENVAKNALKLPVRVGPVDASAISKYKIRDNTWYTAISLTLFSTSMRINGTLENVLGDNAKQVKSFFKSLLSQLLP